MLALLQLLRAIGRPGRAHGAPGARVDSGIDDVPTLYHSIPGYMSARRRSRIIGRCESTRHGMIATVSATCQVRFPTSSDVRDAALLRTTSDTWHPNHGDHSEQPSSSQADGG